MSRFSELINGFEKQWKETSVPLFADLKRQVTHPSVMTREKAAGIICKLSSHYYSFVSNIYTIFEGDTLSTSEREELQQFIKSLYTSVYEDAKILTDIYKEKEREALFRPHLFQAKPGELPIPTFEEQFKAGKVFPDDQEQYPEYYTCNFT